MALADGDPAAAAEVAESLTLGFLVVLDALSATERAVFLLADVFGEPFAEISAAVGKTEDNCRQIARSGSPEGPLRSTAGGFACRT